MGEHTNPERWYEQFRAPARYNRIQRTSHYIGIGIGALAVLALSVTLVWGAVRVLAWLVGTVFG